VKLRAVTFDFWNTLVDGAPTPVRTAERVARLHSAIAGAGAACTPEQLLDAFDKVTRHLDDAARESFEEVGPPGRWAALARELDIPDSLIPYAVVEKAYEDITLNPPPALMPHVIEAVTDTKRKGYRLGVICNTGMAGGRVLREVLRRHGLLELFDVTTFSNEVGLGKPHPAIFEQTLASLGDVAPDQALHVGDMEDLDIEGARRAGWHSALYAPSSNGHVQSDAEMIVNDWRDFSGQVAKLAASA
jgi:FMN phosphatase YigB (HAD superfamily)